MIGGHPLQPDWKQSSHRERFAAVRPYVEGRSVLDIGAGTGYRRSDWMHGLIAEAARETVGLELDRRKVAEGIARGADLREGNAESFDLGRTFEVVWAGELIEHLDNPGHFLDAARRHLAPDGRLVLTTPNVFGVSNFVYRLWGTARVNAEHTCWFCEVTLRQLLERHGFEVEEISYLAHRTPGRARSLAARLVRWPLPDRLAENTILAVASASGV